MEEDGGRNQYSIKRINSTTHKVMWWVKERNKMFSKETVELDYKGI